MQDEIILSFAKRGLSPLITVPAAGKGKPLVTCRCPAPFSAASLGFPARHGQYRGIAESSGTFVAEGMLDMLDGTRLAFQDTWRPARAQSVEIERVVTVDVQGRAEGVNTRMSWEVAFAQVMSFDDVQLVVPGAFYGKNDTDDDGRDDYLQTYDQDYRDDRLPSMSLVAWSKRDQRFVALARADPPRQDEALTRAQIVARHFVHATDIGSLGFSPSLRHPAAFDLRASYPFCESSTFCLNTQGEGWAAYFASEQGRRIRVSYRLTFGNAGSLTEAAWKMVCSQMGHLAAQPDKVTFSFDQSLRYRQELVLGNYRRWEAEERAGTPAGFMIHFSPRSGKQQHQILEYGFTGAQILLAYDILRLSASDPSSREKALSVIDFFVRKAPQPNGWVHGLYDVPKKDYVYWWTGILLPFQYSHAKGDLEKYLGAQVVEALLPIGEKLQRVKGNYLRTMCDAIYPLLLAYRAEQERGVEHKEWLEAASRFGDFLLRVQESDGTWHRGYDTEGNPLRDPAEWFGASDTERKSGTIFPVSVLCELFQITEDRRFLKAARKACAYIIDRIITPVAYCGGLNDTTHVKSVKIDAVGVMFALRSCVRLYELTGENPLLLAAVDAARMLATWVYLWNIPFPPKSLLGRWRFGTTGWTVCDVIPAGSYVDCELAEFLGDLLKTAEWAKDEHLFEIAELGCHGMQHGLSTPERLMGYARPGIQCEGYMTGYWLSDTEVTEFSGAAAKGKGADNDTCNGLVNAQSIYGMLEVRERYGTLDFAEIRKKLFT